MDKLVLGFIADLLYLKGIITYHEFEDIQSVKQAEDVEHIIEKMLRGEYDDLRQQGEGYVRGTV